MKPSPALDFSFVLRRNCFAELRAGHYHFHVVAMCFGMVPLASILFGTLLFPTRPIDSEDELK